MTSPDFRPVRPDRPAAAGPSVPPDGTARGDSIGVLGEAVGIPAGGNNQPWTGRVTFSAPAGTALTLVVSTGGHAGSGVERYAIMGLRAG